MALPLITPAWPVHPRVRAACTTREGGVSKAPYDSLNLGDHVGDDPAAVAENRDRLRAALAARPVFMKQVHGWRVAQLREETPDGIEADACFATGAGVACTIMVADCLPVLIAAADGSVVGAAHAGWRGLLGEGGRGALEALWAQLMAHGADADAAVWLGPCIGPRAFEVGPEVKAAFEAVDASTSRHFTPHAPGKGLADLPALARDRLRALGLANIHGNDGTDDWCTVTRASRFFSHRRDRVSGRLAACVWLG